MIRTAICAFAALVVAAAPARASCWQSHEVAAAKIKDMDTMMMVASLRCRRVDSGHVARYNAFVVKHRAPLTEANVVLRDRFKRMHGGAHALNAYDRYVVRVANRYGAGVGGLDCADFAAITAAADSERPSFAALHAIADRAATNPMLDGTACAVTLARR